MMNKLTRRRILFSSAGMAGITVTSLAKRTQATQIMDETADRLIRLANGWKVQKMKMTARGETGDRPS